MVKQLKSESRASPVCGSRDIEHRCSLDISLKGRYILIAMLAPIKKGVEEIKTKGDSYD
jgi:hypothetical protein